MCCVFFSLFFFWSNFFLLLSVWTFMNFSIKFNIYRWYKWKNFILILFVFNELKIKTIVFLLLKAIMRLCLFSATLRDVYWTVFVVSIVVLDHRLVIDVLLHHFDHGLNYDGHQHCCLYCLTAFFVMLLWPSELVLVGMGFGTAQYSNDYKFLNKPVKDGGREILEIYYSIFCFRHNSIFVIQPTREQ